MPHPSLSVSPCWATPEFRPTLRFTAMSPHFADGDPESVDPVNVDAVVIGAGHAGLAIGAALQDAGLHPLLLEAGDSVGTSWRARHDGLRLNTIRWLSGLPGRPIPRESGRWVSRDDYTTYLERFARGRGLDIKFGVRAQRIDPAGPPGWRVVASAGSYQTPHVIVATGHENIPRLPTLPGHNAVGLPIRHVATVKRAADFAGQRVLLLGAGNSGIEMASHLVHGGVERLWLSVRTAPTILPREIYGIPLHPLTVATRHLPERVRDRLARALARHAFGDLTPHGLPAPQEGPFRRMRTAGVTVAVDQGFVEQLVAGRLETVAAVERLEGGDVVLMDGRRVRPDVIIAATGYRPGLETLVGHLEVLDHKGNPRGRPGRPAAKGLWFIGFWPAIEGNLRQHPSHAKMIARAIAADHSAGRPPQTPAHTLPDPGAPRPGSSLAGRGDEH